MKEFGSPFFLRVELVRNSGKSIATKMLQKFKRQWLFELAKL